MFVCSQVECLSAMERVTGGGMLPFILSGVGVFLLIRILFRLRQGVPVQGLVVVITGASSGLGKGQPSALFITEYHFILLIFSYM